ncbi:DUF4382 domain-containing protein [Chloroflexota bacterium]
MKKSFIFMTVLALMVTLLPGCAPEGAQAPILPAPEQIAPSSTPTDEEVNFRLLVSDEVNAIGDFDKLNVTITRIGVQQSSESGGWIEYDLIDPGETVDLTELKGSNATEIWNGKLDNGTYNKVFIYVSNVEGVLIEGEANVKLPSGKLQISIPFEVTNGEVTEFVYDITVIKAGENDKYILKPQIGESGPDKDFNDVTTKGKPEDTGKPEDKGKPEGTGKPEKLGNSEGEVELHLDGEPVLGDEMVILIVTDNGLGVEGAMVTIDGQDVGSTDAEGHIAIPLPDAPGKVKIEVLFEHKRGELEIELEEVS